MALSITASAATQRLRPSPVVLIRSRDVTHADRLVATGRLVRIRSGVFAPGDEWRGLAPWNRYLGRVHALLLVRPSAVLCFESAAAIHGLPVFGDPLTVHVLDDATGTSRELGDVRTHTSTNDRRIIEVDGVQVVDLVDTAVDLARSRHRASGLAVADAALRMDPGIRAEVLVAANESRSSARGRRHARWVTHRATALAETPLESVSRAAVEWLGFDEPELQRRFLSDGVVDRVDMWWEDARIVGEADGDVKYDGSLQSPERAIRDEKSRDRRLARHARGIGHWGWADVLRVEPLRAELRRAGLRIRHPEDSRELSSMRDLVPRRHR